ncbi:hypothetical protein M5X00_06435 [Paenibacillus alvei]|uniref:Uncharacterized protein n=1 Tax=Paenibacillus alvei TaxID=44250 RepID=A0AAP7A6C5_PAEAL|nr:hypothetical protein [Paenibacillus alvei]EJW14675.1 hypothetical protein PAV_11c00150 [Paenibacillus alvei DSM 29]MBG9737126.1 hypothetical protein [Paenibacillus alvei]MBG9746219.1 hypothetical protein [Paenibacillus alvei]MCY7486088.1 hypothetical protein [Paenibacillus alvei]MCY9544049.1 hypothetical protein [Paenibacillus alvei]
MLYPTSSQRSVFKFNVDILVQGESNVAALEALLQLLQQHPDILDARVQSGSELGSLLELAEAMQQHNMKQSPFDKLTQTHAAQASSTTVDTRMDSPAARTHSKKNATGSGSTADKALQNAANEPKQTNKQQADDARLQDVEKQLRNYIDQNCLLRLRINKGKGITMSLPCRILNYDASNQLLNVYHVDEKQVYAFNLNEIEDMQP